MSDPVPSHRPADGDPGPSAPPVRARWGLGDAAAGFLIGLVLSAVLASAWLGATGQDDLSLGGQALSELGLWAGLAGCVVFASRRKGSGRLSRDFGFAGRWIDLPVGVAVGLLTQEVLLPLLEVVLRPVLGEPDVSGPVEELFDKASGVSTAVLVLFVVVGAPVVEELFFRGLLLRSFLRRFGAAAAILLSGVLFGMAHPQPLEAAGLALVMISLAVFAVVLGILVVRTGRLGPAIVAHATFNLWTALDLLTR